MSDFNIDDSIKDLSPELQKKAKECKSVEEAMALAAENDIEVSNDVLEQISGGGCGSCSHPSCTKIESKPPDFLAVEFLWIKRKCDKCGKTLYYIRWLDYNMERELSKEQYDAYYNPYK